MESSVVDLSRYRFESSVEAYLDFYVASKSEAQEQIAQAEEFIKVIGDYLKKQGVV